MYNYLKQRFKHAIRFRHKRGYGVHSPFVFDLITSVIKEKAVYYDFERIEAMGNIREKERKLYRLLFRLAEYFSYRNVLCVGVRSPWVSMYLAAVSKQMVLLNGGCAYLGAEYTEQVKRGVKLDKEHYLKRFPVWFSIFNGNTAIHLSTGKSAAICGNFLKDEELLNIGREQLYWTVGKNPFGQSLIYGEGYNYPQMNSFSSGEMTGEMPVGIRTLGNDDIPYWPQTNNACYKEVWVTSAGKWLSLIAEY